MRYGVVVLAGLLILVSAGCQKRQPQEPQGAPQTANSQTGPAAVTVPAGAWWIEHHRLSDRTPACAVVHVQGCPLIFTRQVFGNPEKDEKTQISEAFEELVTILRVAGSSADRIARLNVVATTETTLAATLKFLGETFRPGYEPAITFVVSPLPTNGTTIAFDAIAVPTGNVGSSRRWEAKNATGLNKADAVVIPPSGLVFFSGQPDKSSLPEAATNALKSLLAMAKDLKVATEDVVQLRVFAQPVTEAAKVMEEIKKAFGTGNVPPVVFTEWLASAPIEIEMIARLPEGARSGEELVRFYNPPDVKPSATFSRVTIVQEPRFVFLPTLVAAEAGSAEEQANRVFADLEELLTNFGSDWKHLAKATYFVADKEASAAVDIIRTKFFDPQRPPAASKVTVHGIGLPGRTLSVDMIAVPLSRLETSEAK